jgi:hypothetical protein
VKRRGISCLERPCVGRVPRLVAPPGALGHLDRRKPRGFRPGFPRCGRLASRAGGSSPCRAGQSCIGHGGCAIGIESPFAGRHYANRS